MSGRYSCFSWSGSVHSRPQVRPARILTHVPGATAGADITCGARPKIGFRTHTPARPSYERCELTGCRTVPAPVPSGIRKWLYRQMSQDVCPWNVRFASELPDDSPLAPREAVTAKDARTFAREILQMTQPEFSAAFRVADEAGEAARAQAQRGRGARQRRHA